MTLDSYLADAGLTEAAFAAVAGVDQSTINRIRKGAHPSPKVTKAIVERTGGKVTPNDLFGMAA